MNATEVITSTTLVLGHDGDWWDFWMLASLVVVGLVGLAAAAFTTGSVLVHKREAAAASAKLEGYKLEMLGKVAEATSAGILAGERAGHAQTDVDATKVELAKQQTKTEEARTIAKGFESKIAESDARAKTAEAQVATAMAASEEASAKAELFRRDIARANESAVKAEAQVASAQAEAAKANLEVARLKLPRSLSDVPGLISSLVAFKGTKYTFTGVGAWYQCIWGFTE